MLNFSARICLKHYGIAVEATLLAMTITACNTSSPTSPSVATPSGVQPSSSIASSPSPIAPPQSSPSPTSSPTPTPGDVGDEALQQEAVQVIRDYYRAIARRDYEQAYLAWGREGAASQQSFEQFKQGFANTSSVAIEVGEPGRLDGAAGSLYIDLPVTVTAVTIQGTPQRFRGSYRLRRVNDVPGSTPAQRKWHLYSADITQVN